MNFKLNLKYYRKIRNMSQSKLAEKAGLTQQYISLLEANDRTESPTLTSIEKLSQALDICPYALLEYKCKEFCNKVKVCDIVNLIQETDFIAE